MDYKFLQTLAFVAWVQQQVETAYSREWAERAHIGVGKLDVFHDNVVATVIHFRLRNVYLAATAGNHREYLRLVAGCPPEFKNRVFIDNAPVDWSPVQSRGNNQSWYWRELGR